MKEFFKRKKVIITGHPGSKSVWLKKLLTEWDANILDTTNVYSKHDMNQKFLDEEPEIVFHIASSPSSEKIISPYISTANILEAIQKVASVTSAIVIPAEREENTLHTSLNEEEKQELAKLLEKVDSVQIRGEIWHQLVKKFITVPIELCILDDDNRVFLAYRNDREFDGYHMPGTVVNDWETVNEACIRLVTGEVMRDAGFTISPPQSIGWIEVRRGRGEEESKTRNAVSLLHVAHLTGDFSPKDGQGFYDFDTIPENTLGHHKYLLRVFARHVKTGETILGK